MGNSWLRSCKKTAYVVANKVEVYGAVKKKKSEENSIQEDVLEEVAGGKNKTNTTTYENIIEGNNNVVIDGDGKQLLEKFDTLYAKGAFNNLGGSD